jgi:hypothetical protein
MQLLAQPDATPIADHLLAEAGLNAQQTATAASLIAAIDRQVQPPPQPVQPMPAQSGPATPPAMPGMGMPPPAAPQGAQQAPQA